MKSLRLALLAFLSVSASLLAGPGKEIAPPVIVPEEAPFFSGSLTAAWDSKYVTEGRDNLDESGLVSTELAVAAAGFTALAWYADGYDTAYSELNLGLEYAHEFGDFTAALGYTWLYFFEDDVDDNELGASLAWGGLGFVEPAIAYVYSTEAEGSFIELSLASEIALIAGPDAESEPVWTLLPAVILGIDMGYASEQHDGTNHLQFQLETAYALSSTVSLSGYIAQTLGLDDVDEEDGDDLFFGGVKLTVAF